MKDLTLIIPTKKDPIFTKSTRELKKYNLKTKIILSSDDRHY